MSELSTHKTVLMIIADGDAAVVVAFMVRFVIHLTLKILLHFTLTPSKEESDFLQLHASVAAQRNEKGISGITRHRHRQHLARARVTIEY